MVKIPSIHRLLWLPNSLLFRRYTSNVTKKEHKLWSIRFANIELNVIKKNVPLSKREDLRKFAEGARKHLQTEPVERNFPYKAKIVSFKIDPNAFKEDTDSSGSDSDREINAKAKKVEIKTQSKTLVKEVDKIVGPSSIERFTGSKLHKQEQKVQIDSAGPSLKRKYSDNDVHIDWNGHEENIEVDKKVESISTSNKNVPVVIAGEKSVKDESVDETSSEEPSSVASPVKRDKFKTESSDEHEHLTAKDRTSKKETDPSLSRQLVKVSKDICTDTGEENGDRKVIVREKFKTESSDEHEHLTAKYRTSKKETDPSLRRQLVKVSKDICTDTGEENGDRKVIVHEKFKTESSDEHEHLTAKYRTSKKETDPSLSRQLVKVSKDIFTDTGEENGDRKVIVHEKFKTKSPDKLENLLDVKVSKPAKEKDQSDDICSDLEEEYGEKKLAIEDKKNKDSIHEKEETTSNSCDEGSDTEMIGTKSARTSYNVGTSSENRSNIIEKTKSRNEKEHKVIIDRCSVSDDVNEHKQNLPQKVQTENVSSTNICNNSNPEDNGAEEITEKRQHTTKKKIISSYIFDPLCQHSSDLIDKVYGKSCKDLCRSFDPLQTKCTANKKSKIDSLCKNTSDQGVGIFSAKKRAEVIKKLPRETLSPREHICSTMYDTVESDGTSKDKVNCDSDDDNGGSSGYSSSGSSSSGSSISDSDNDDEGNSSEHCNTRKEESSNCDDYGYYKSKRQDDDTTCMSFHDYLRNKNRRRPNIQVKTKIWDDLECTDNVYLSKSTSAYCNLLDIELLKELRDIERLKEEENSKVRKNSQNRKIFKRISEWEETNTISGK